LQTLGWNWTKITGPSHEDLGMFIISYHSWNRDKHLEHWEAREVVHNLNIIFFNKPFHTNVCTHAHARSLTHTHKDIIALSSGVNQLLKYGEKLLCI
jgi:hypothetical protein